jgi:hypothetical protein
MKFNRHLAIIATDSFRKIFWTKKRIDKEWQSPDQPRRLPGLK